MKFLISLLLLVSMTVFGAVPDYKAFRGTGGITVTTNPPVGTIIIDGTGISGPTNGVSATVVTSIVNSISGTQSSNNVRVVGGTNIFVSSAGSGGVQTYTVSVAGLTNIVQSFIGSSTNASGDAITNLLWNKTIFVDAANGNDATAIRGDAAKPWLTVSNAFRAVQSGDTVFIRPGTYPAYSPLSSYSDPCIGLTNLTNITIVGGGVGTILTNGNLGTMFALQGCSNVLFADFQVKGTLTNGYSPQLWGAVEILNTNWNVTFQRMIFQNCHDQAISGAFNGAGAEGARSKSINVLDSSFYNVGNTNSTPGRADGAAFSCFVSGSIVSRNTFYNCACLVEQYNNGVTVGAVFSDNVADETLWIGVQLGGGGLGGYTNIVIANNRLRGSTVANSLAHIAIQLDGAYDSVIEGNTISEFEAGVQMDGSRSGWTGAENVLIRNNIFRNMGVEGVWCLVPNGVTKAANRISVVGNIFHTLGGPAVRLSGNDHRIEWNDVLNSGTNGANSAAISIGYFAYATSSSNCSVIGNYIGHSGPVYSIVAMQIFTNAYNTTVLGNRTAYQIANYSTNEFTGTKGFDWVRVGTNWGSPNAGDVLIAFDSSGLGVWDNQVTKAYIQKLQTGSFLLTNFMLMGISNILAANGIAIGTNNGVLWITNTSLGGGGGGVTNNVNQFASTGTTNSIKDGARLTNITHYGVLASQGVNITAGSYYTSDTFARHRALISDDSYEIAESVTTDAELAFLSGVTSAIQPQLSNDVRVVAGANITVTPSGSGNIMTYTVAGSAGGGDAGGTNSRQFGSAVLTNLVGLASTVFTNVPLGGTNISVRTTGGTNFIDTTGQLNNWAQIPTGAVANVVSTTFLTNWANAISNLTTTVNGEVSLTNANMFGLVNGKVGITNLIRSIAAREGLVGTNEGGTNISLAINPVLTNITIYGLTINSNLTIVGAGVGGEKFWDHLQTEYFVFEAPFNVQTNNVLRLLSNGTAGVLVAQPIATGTNQMMAIALTPGQYVTYNGTTYVGSNLPAAGAGGNFSTNTDGAARLYGTNGGLVAMFDNAGTEFFGWGAPPNAQTNVVICGLSNATPGLMAMSSVGHSAGSGTNQAYAIPVGTGVLTNNGAGVYGWMAIPTGGNVSSNSSGGVTAIGVSTNKSAVYFESDVHLWSPVGNTVRKVLNSTGGATTGIGLGGGTASAGEATSPEEFYINTSTTAYGLVFGPAYFGIYPRGAFDLGRPTFPFGNIYGSNIFLKGGSPEAGKVLTAVNTVGEATWGLPPNAFAVNTISGSGNGNTNYFLQANYADMVMGSSNVNIVSVTNGVLGTAYYWNAVITNRSAINWGISYSQVWNYWRFSSSGGGTNPPYVLAAGTALMLSGRTHGSNNMVGWTTFPTLPQ